MRKKISGHHLVTELGEIYYNTKPGTTVKSADLEVTRTKAGLDISINGHSLHLIRQSGLTKTNKRTSSWSFTEPQDSNLVDSLINPLDKLLGRSSDFADHTIHERR